MPKPVNVLLISTDQMRWDHMGCAGIAQRAPNGPTPLKDWLARGVRVVQGRVVVARSTTVRAKE